jgi:type II restriction enzyme
LSQLRKSAYPAISRHRPVADFICPSCEEEFEVKSQKTAFRQKNRDGAFKTMCERLAASNNPNLLLLNYDLERLQVTNSYCSEAFLHPRND